MQSKLNQSMKRDTHKTDVIFRYDTTKGFNGTIFALFPHEVCDSAGNVTSYQHVGQHGSADYNWSVYKSRLAKPNEYADLKTELEGLGYNLNVVYKQNKDKYIKSLKEVRK